MGTEVRKRTYNLPAETIEEVRSIAGALDVSQDSVVERAIREYARLQRDRAHDRAWASASETAKFQAEMSELAREFAADDLAAWER